MPDLSALELQARDVSPIVSTRSIDRALMLFSGALFTLALTAGGAVVTLVALTVGVVGAPVIVVVLATLALRRRPAPAAGALVTTG
jgi:hypothetical protein